MKISSFQQLSLIDYPGKFASVVFAQGCNYRCPACHAKHVIEGQELISENEVFSYIDSRKGWIDGIVICGGEPTLQMDLKYFAKECKNRGLSVKLDTNGSNYVLLGKLLEEKLIDYIAMDVKGPLHLYRKLTGLEVFDDRDRLQKPLLVVQKAPDYEFRTTIAPIIRDDGQIRFMTPDEARKIAEWIVGVTGDNSHKYFLQKFVARSREEMINERFSKEKLPKEMHETPESLLKESYEKARKYLPNCTVR